MLRSSVLAASLLFSQPVASEEPAQTCSAPVAVPSSVTTPHSTYYTDTLPPERFRGNGKITVSFTGQRGVNAVCGVAPCNMRTLGCTSTKVMTLLNPCNYPSSDAYAQLVCHELGHLNGWPATHGD